MPLSVKYCMNEPKLLRRADCSSSIEQLLSITQSTSTEGTGSWVMRSSRVSAARSGGLYLPSWAPWFVRL